MDPLTYLAGLETLGIKLGLHNIRALTDAMGRPQEAFRSILVAGTNGKGSVAAMVAAALHAAGHRSSRYTSPHLIRLEERFWIGGRTVDTARLEDAVQRVRVAAEGLQARGVLAAPPTFFEAATAAAFDLFAGEGVEIAVLEVGLGGRLDATNCVEPTACAITSIARDHERLLGSSLEAIAREKAGVVRPGVPVVIGRMPAEARDAIEATCAAVGAVVVRAEERFAATVHLARGLTVLEAARGASRAYGDVTLGLRGRHQGENAAVAVALLEVLDAGGVAVPVHAVVTGLASPGWRARLEVVTRPDGRTLVLDAAHNPAGAAALARYLTEAFDRRAPIVFGAMTDKDAEGMIAALAPATPSMVMTRARSPRAADPADLAARARRIAPDLAVEVRPDPAEALEAAWAVDRTICVAGSVWLIGEVLASTEIAPAES